MKKFFILAFALLVLASCGDDVFVADCDIELTSEDIYQIKTTKGMYAFVDLVNGYAQTDSSLSIKGNIEFTGTPQSTLQAELMTNIDLDATTYGEWTPIGSESYPFSGDFDGNNFTISGLLINDSTGENQGLFGYLDEAEVHEFTLKGSVVGGENVGAFAGYVKGSHLHYCYNYATVSGSVNVGGVAGYTVKEDASTTMYMFNNKNFTSVKGSAYVGGIVGRAYSETQFMDCINNAAVEGENYVGGIVGFSENMVFVKTSTNNGVVTGTGNSSYNIGGIAGCGDYSYIISCTNKAKVSGYNNVAGIVGLMTSSSSTYIEGCSNTAEIRLSSQAETGTHQYVAGIVGLIENMTLTITDCTNSGTIYYYSLYGCGQIYGYTEEGGTVYMTGELEKGATVQIL